jgi:hypothetical protein
MKTYLEVTVSSDGEKASIITSKLIEIGFETGYGQHDFIYNWKKEPVLPELLKFIDQIQGKLKGSNVLLKFETV